jgi:hypothetical protein
LIQTCISGDLLAHPLEQGSPERDRLVIHISDDPEQREQKVEARRHPDGSQRQRGPGEEELDDMRAERGSEEPDGKEDEGT